MPICPSGHDSASADYCDVCGLQIDAGQAAASAGHVSAPGSPGGSGPAAGSVAGSAAGSAPGSGPGSGPGPASGPASGGGASPGGEVCPEPDCGAPRTGRFCEECGYDFATGTPGFGRVSADFGPPAAGPAAGPGYGPGYGPATGGYGPASAGYGPPGTPGYGTPSAGYAPGTGGQGYAAPGTGHPGAHPGTGHPGAGHPGMASPGGGHSGAVPSGAVPSGAGHQGSGTGHTAGHPAGAQQTPGHPPGPPYTGWHVVASADRAYYDTVIAQGGPDAAKITFPPYCPDRVFPLIGTHIQIGRRSRSRGINPEIDLSGVPEDPGISHLHAVLIAQPDGSWTLVDPGSANGTKINDAPDPIPTNTPVPVSDGDRVYLGAWTVLMLRKG